MRKPLQLLRLLGITVEQQEEASKIINDLNINIYGAFVVDPSFTRKDFNALASHIRQLKPTANVISILTPLPGTELYASKINELTTDKPELYDLAHTVLPTVLPLKDFYSEYIKLYSKALTLPRLVKYICLFEKGQRLSTIRHLNKMNKQFKQTVLGTVIK